MAEYLDGKGRFDYHKWSRVRKSGASETQLVSEGSTGNRELIKLENEIYSRTLAIKRLLDNEAEGATVAFDKLERAFFNGMKAIVKKYKL